MHASPIPGWLIAMSMQRVLPEAAFHDWLEGFLPHLDVGKPAVLFEPAIVSDRSDGKIAHLDGLNFSRAWCCQSIATAVRMHHCKLD